MKKIYLPFLLCFFLIGCSSAKMEKPESPEELAHIMKLALSNGDYSKFNSYLTEPKKGLISMDQFKELSKITTAGTEYRTYSYIKMENGKVLLLEIIKDIPSEDYKVQRVIEVPEEIKNIFDNNL
ncbi:hypothetical protein BVG16_26590 [Paenibacillus selenitireducens]|uniref:DUF4878 domain-containing protein n=1 Tax=Paenibacillus selenitireducens TaxID=1324314 RepID=A0A1T2X1C1_9BACL|nr:hypothetical protein [Paenibacillus selenitireducens]OPA73671.1 hypothetical protein BVG16_26590 [Paenibacillus selenitireducens]